MGELVRWNLKVSKEADISLRSLLAERGGKKGDLSRFVEQAVRRAVLNETVSRIRAQNEDLSAEALQELIDTELAAMREEFWRDRRWW